MKTKLEIIDETAEYYSADPVNRRAVDEASDCVYRADDGRMCAVGRCLIDPGSFDDTLRAFDIRNLDTKLKPEYMGHNLGFWDDLQNFHDYHKNWTTNGLSNEGEIALSELREKYAS